MSEQQPRDRRSEPEVPPEPRRDVDGEDLDVSAEDAGQVRGGYLMEEQRKSSYSEQRSKYQEAQQKKIGY